MKPLEQLQAEAYGAGVAAGQNGRPHLNPYNRDDLRDIWEAGYNDGLELAAERDLE